MKKIVLSLIILYQRFLSPDKSFFRFFFAYPVCRFSLTCSDYSFQAIKKYGIFKGGFLGLKRILSCHPFSKKEENNIL